MMTYKSRYLLLLLGAVFFIITAPLLLLYVQGKTLDYSTKKTIAEGLFAIRTIPKSASVDLDHKPQNKTPVNLRFIQPGDHTITITKDGYLPWTKILQAKPGKVTWVNPNPQPIYLFLENPTEEIFGADIQVFYHSNDEIYALSQKFLKIINLEDLNKPKSYSLPDTYTSITESPDHKWLMLSNGASKILFQKFNHTILNIPKDIQDWDSIKFGLDETILGIKNGSLYEFNIKKQTTRLIQANILSFDLNSEALYLLSQSPTGSELSILDLPLTNELQDTTISDHLPRVYNPTLIATEQKLIFLKDGSSLYRINPNAQLLAENVNNHVYNPDDASLIFTTDSELDYYSFSDNSVHLISRSISPFSSPNLRSDLAYSFFIQDNKIIALELDNRGNQNRYELINSPNIEQFLVSPNGKIIYFLTDKTLKSAQIQK